METEIEKEKVDLYALLFNKAKLAARNNLAGKIYRRFYVRAGIGFILLFVAVLLIVIIYNPLDWKLILSIFFVFFIACFVRHVFLPIPDPSDEQSNHYYKQAFNETKRNISKSVKENVQQVAELANKIIPINSLIFEGNDLLKKMENIDYEIELSENTPIEYLKKNKRN